MKIGDKWIQKYYYIDYIETENKQGLKQLYIDGKIATDEYRNACEMFPDSIVIDYDLTPEQYAAQFKRAKRYYNALTLFVCIDIITLMWLALFFIYFPVVIYTWVFVFGKRILLPNDEAVAENNQLGKFTILSWIPGIGIVADMQF